MASEKTLDELRNEWRLANERRLVRASSAQDVPTELPTGLNVGDMLFGVATRAAEEIREQRKCHQCSLKEQRNTPGTVYGYNYVSRSASHVPRWACDKHEPTRVLYRQTDAEAALLAILTKGTP